ncbi:tetraacyldisaccharide 4'-kinase [Rhodoferax antarcticus]|uniref:Tetraacyldisaccharide 4'-kinase n=1 Tax=Rhodoferax antarcticus ANT.BR TaxID=1111071 RepID=A0A1Q8YFE6_9BURK|nr:tetraacyldisaccharide 4'-kinase [Rhodoferax antarcticus]APW46474.1 tetraacyldisaccharide 4'-kinase [Rhodoferax antarcticus]OLP06746.1 tetraacyldisaccharide 4'-kinase [Rhodoferax antarcticus ANT.BR]
MPALTPTPAWQQTLRRAWTQRGLLAWLLWPMSMLYGLLVAIRTTLYHWGVFKAQRVPVPVVVVGNVVAGGAGKTPVVIALAEHWCQRGIRVGVISRGYGRSTPGCLEVTRERAAQEVGDEPALIHRRTGAPVFVAERRIDAARALLARHPDTQIILSDDGLQHLALHRDLEIGVFDERGVGNGFLLPAGPLREPWPRKLDLVLRSGIEPAFDGYRIQRTLADHAVTASGEQVPLARLIDTPGASAKPVLALAAIAQPEVFFSMLRAKRLTLAHTLGLPDHYDFKSFSRNEYKGYRLICTEKDAVKLWPLCPDALAVPLISVLPDDFWAALDAHTNALLDLPTSF